MLDKTHQDDPCDDCSHWAGVLPATCSCCARAKALYEMNQVKKDLCNECAFDLFIG